MPTICGLRRRGFTPESIRLFAEKVGVAKRDNIIDLSLLEWCVREDLNKRANRYMAVLDPVKLVVTNYPEGQTEIFTAPKNPEIPEAGVRQIPFGRELYIERDDFMENPPKKYFRLQPGGEVRLKFSYIIKCEEVVKNENGQIIEIRCTYDPTSRPGTGEWRSVKGTIHWLAASNVIDAKVQLFDRLFTQAEMDSIPEGDDYKNYLNPDSLKVVNGFVDSHILEDESGIAVQFERLGYFVKDIDSTLEAPVFNKTVGLKSAW
jgi:glutaminyl-tRNA synthetase